MTDVPPLSVASDLANGVKTSPPVPDDGASQHSETAHDFITSQLQLEADAREALPYSFSHCTRPLGALKQNLFSCLTCNPPKSPIFQPAAVCYSCSIACHGEHTLVELFNRRNFTCDCGTTRMPDESPCTLRIDPATGMKGPVKGEEAANSNTYNQNCKNRFCGCGEIYDAHQEKGTMFQCLGLAQEKDGGCGEDWWHPECVIGLGRIEWAKRQPKKEMKDDNNAAGGEDAEADDDENHPLPPGFPQEDDFDAFICYKCVDANPWIRQYAGTDGFLPAVYHQSAVSPNGHSEPAPSSSASKPDSSRTITTTSSLDPSTAAPSSPRKRTASDAALDDDNDTASSISKNPKLSSNSIPSKTTPAPPDPAYHASLPPPPPKSQPISLFAKEDFRSHFCRCKTCYPLLSTHPQLLEEESHYSPPLSSSSIGDGSPSHRSLLDRGEAALSNVDRVRAIEGVMVYNHLKDKVKSFLQPFAESGRAVGAEDIKAYFEKLRGDEGGIAAAVEGAAGMGGGGGGESGGSGAGASENGRGKGEGDYRREQGGY